MGTRVGGTRVGGWDGAPGLCLKSTLFCFFIGQNIEFLGKNRIFGAAAPILGQNPRIRILLKLILPDRRLTVP